MMPGFEELKNAYKTIKDEYGYICTNIMPPDEYCEGQTFIFEYQGFPEKQSFVYILYDTPYPENDEVIFWSSEETVDFSAAAYFAITNLMEAFQDNRDNKDVMDEFIKYLRKEIPNE